VKYFIQQSAFSVTHMQLDEDTEMY